MLEPQVIYEDEDIVAINKPAGLVVHSDGRTKEPTVSDWFIEKYPEAKDVGEPLGEIARPGVVHRIDRETSGVLLLAKTDLGHECLKEQFQNREIDKVYHVFIHGNLKENHGTINLPIGKSSSDFRKRSAERGAKGERKEAITHFQVLKRFEGGTFVEARPKTGRTHQIRVHFKALHHPVLGDSLYGSKKPELLGFKRVALHAREISFLDTKGEKHALKASYPEDFKQAMDTVGLSVLD